MALLRKERLCRELASHEISKEEVRQLLLQYNKTPSNYLILERDTQFYRPTCQQGVIGYRLCHNTVFVIAEPICAEDHLIQVVEEFKQVCSHAGYRICFNKITETRLWAFEAAHFFVQDYGLEGLLNTEDFTLNGSVMAKVRWGVNKTTKLGYHVTEYKPSTHRNSFIEESMVDICKEWIEKKNNIELSFMLGELAFDDPMDRRYFFIESQNHKVEAFITYVPYDEGRGYYLDVMRKSHSASLGTMEKLIVDSLEHLKSGGVTQISLGLAPLAEVISGSSLQSKMLTYLFNQIFESAQSIYGFKALYQFKKKFNPIWERRYIAFYPPRVTPGLIASLAKIKYEDNIFKMLLIQVLLPNLKNSIKRWRNKEKISKI